MNVLTSGKAVSSEVVPAYYQGIETNAPLNRELRGRLIGAIVLCFVASGTIVYLIPFLVWFTGNGQYSTTLYNNSRVVADSLIRPEGDYIAMALGLLAIGATLFVLTADGSGLRRRGQLAESEAIVSFVSFINLFLAALFLVLVLFMVNLLIGESETSFKSMLISVLGFVLCGSLSVLRGSSAGSRISALEYNEQCRAALVFCRDSIPPLFSVSAMRLYLPPIAISLGLVAIHIICLSADFLYGSSGLLCGLGSAIYISLAIGLETYRQVCSWNQTRSQRRSSVIFRTQVCGSLLIAVALPLILFSSEWPNIGSVAEIVVVLIALASLAASAIVPLVYMQYSRKMRASVLGRQRMVIDQRIHSIDTWIEQQKIWLASATQLNDSVI
ncbi:hypothetical protein [Brevibacterium sediminis]|uniref:hypothetical protein n=1 Tax=Brevibacterium sediminis TaxID=1857024 RepID=UPI003B3AA047